MMNRVSDADLNDLICVETRTLLTVTKADLMYLSHFCFFITLIIAFDFAS